MTSKKTSTAMLYLMGKTIVMAIVELELVYFHKIRTCTMCEKIYFKSIKVLQICLSLALLQFFLYIFFTSVLKILLANLNSFFSLFKVVLRKGLGNFLEEKHTSLSVCINRKREKIFFCLLFTAL